MGHWLIDTAGVGAMIAILVGASVAATYLAVLRWIKIAPPDHAQNDPSEPGGGEA